nr:hypothetical protein [Xanthomonas arboricola]
MMKRSRSVTVPLLLALLATLSSACARPSETEAHAHPSAGKMSAPQATAEATTSGINAGTASLSVQELEARLLRFVDAFKTPADMSSRRLETALGIKLGPPSDTSDPWYRVKDVPLADGYTLYATHFPMKRGFSRMEISVRLPGGEDPTRKPTAICIWDAAALSKKLEAMGYKAGERMPFQNGWIRQHWRSINNGKQGFSVALLIYQSGEEPSRECAFGLQIDGGDV